MELSDNLSIALVAGESSGDLLAGQILCKLKTDLPKVRLYGIGGQHMIKQGFISNYSMDTLTTRGLFEVLPHYFSIKNIQNTLRNQLLLDPPAIFIGIDYPGFNLDLELKLRKAGIPTIHFISPQIWAWRRWRIKKIIHAVSHMLVIFPFEEAIYRNAGIPVTYVGHPLAEIIPMEPDQTMARMSLGLLKKRYIIAILPGSRILELKYNSASFLGAAKILARREPQLHFIIPMAGILQYTYFLEMLAKDYHIDFSLQVICNQSYTAITAADVVLVASGTATLEVALHKKPMVIAYKIMPVSYAIMRYMNYQPWIGLPNILAREFLVPEFLQNSATSQNLANALWEQLNNFRYCLKLRQRFIEIHHLLLRNTTAISAQVICSYLK